MDDQQSAPDEGTLSGDIREKGIQQLEAEIRLLEEWLDELSETSDENTASVEARRNYLDMINSRKELLELIR